MSSRRMAAAIKRSFGGEIKKISDETGFQLGTLYSWSNHLSGKRSPHLSVVNCAEASERSGVPREDADAGIFEICAERDIAAFHIPRIDGSGDEVYREFVRTSRELGDVAAELEKALDPKGKRGREISATEAEDICKQIDEHIRAVAILKAAVRAKAKEGQ